MLRHIASLEKDMRELVDTTAENLRWYTDHKIAMKALEERAEEDDLSFRRSIYSDRPSDAAGQQPPLHRARRPSSGTGDGL